MTLKKFLEHWELDQGSIQVAVQAIHFQVQAEEMHPVWKQCLLV